MKVASVILSFAALVFTLIGTSEFMPMVQSAVIDVTAWLAATFLNWLGQRGKCCSASFSGSLSSCTYGRAGSRLGLRKMLQSPKTL
jgi:hypothetical protein